MGSGSDHRQPAQTNVPFIRKENVMETTAINTPGRVPWNKSKFTGQKPPLKLKEIWAIRIRLQLSARTRDLAIFNLAIDSKLRACDLTKLRVRNICHGQHVASRATVMQQKTQRPVQFELTEQTRIARKRGSGPRDCRSQTFCSRAGFTSRHTFQRANTPASCIAGSRRLVSTTRRTEPIQCVGQRHR